MLRPQREARLSSTWFENLPRYAALGGPQVHAFLVHRRSRVAHHVPPRLYYALLKANRIPLAPAVSTDGPRFAAESVEKQRGGAPPSSLAQPPSPSTRRTPETTRPGQRTGANSTVPPIGRAPGIPVALREDDASRRRSLTPLDPRQGASVIVDSVPMRSTLPVEERRPPSPAGRPGVTA